MTRSRLSSRVVGLLLRPTTAWAVIADEESDIGSIYSGHIVILAAIPAMSLLAGLALSGGRYLGVTGIVTAVTAALVGYAVALSFPLAAATVLTMLAPRFKADGGVNEALKIVAYALTPFWLTGISYMFVALSGLVTVGLAWSLYLFFLGATPVMGTPVEQRVPFTAAAAVVTLVLTVAFSWIIELLRLPYYKF